LSLITAHELLQDQLDYQILRSVPSVGPIIALIVLAEAGDFFRAADQIIRAGRPEIHPVTA